jgi:membrane-bound serine protease (ClpP class)
MTGEVGVAKSSLNPDGKVQIHGEIWNAVIQPDEGVVKRGEKVEVVKTEGMKLIVKKKEV